MAGWLKRQPADVTRGQPVIGSGDLEVDIGRRSVTVGGKTVRLTPTVYELLRFLALHAGKPVTHTMLLRQVGAIAPSRCKLRASSGTAGVWRVAELYG